MEICADEVGFADFCEGEFGVADHELAERADTVELAELVHHVEVENHLEVVVGYLKRFDRFFDSGFFGEGEELWGHDGAGGTGLMSPEAIDACGVWAFPGFEDTLCAFFGDAF